MHPLLVRGLIAGAIVVTAWGLSTGKEFLLKKMDGKNSGADMPDPKRKVPASPKPAANDNADDGGKKRGRPPGAKNKPKADEKPPESAAEEKPDEKPADEKENE